MNWIGFGRKQVKWVRKEGEVEETITYFSLASFYLWS
jgi:hypothetical protein